MLEDYKLTVCVLKLAAIRYLYVGGIQAGGVFSKLTANCILQRAAYETSFKDII